MDMKPWFANGTMIGGMVGAFAVILTALPIDDFGVWTTGDSLIFGLLSTATGMLWEIRSIVTRHRSAKDRATRLMVALEHSDLDEDPLVVLCEAAGQIRNMNFTLYTKNDITAEIKSLSCKLDCLAENHIMSIDCEARLQRYINALTKEATQYIYATSAAGGVDETFWETAYGKDYLQVQRHRVEDGVTIRRIFFTGKDSFQPHIMDAMRKQEEIGIKIGAMYNSSIEDFIIFDTIAVISTELTPGGRSVAGGQIAFDDHNISERMTDYDTWWDRAVGNWQALKSSEPATS